MKPGCGCGYSPTDTHRGPDSTRGWICLFDPDLRLKTGNILSLAYFLSTWAILAPRAALHQVHLAGRGSRGLSCRAASTVAAPGRASAPSFSACPAHTSVTEVVSHCIVLVYLQSSPTHQPVNISKAETSTFFIVKSPKFREDWRCYFKAGGTPCIHLVASALRTGTQSDDRLSLPDGVQGRSEIRGGWFSLVLEGLPLHREGRGARRSGGNDGVGIVEVSNNWNCMPAHPSEQTLKADCQYCCLGVYQLYVRQGRRRGAWGLGGEEVEQE